MSHRAPSQLDRLERCVAAAIVADFPTDPPPNLARIIQAAPACFDDGTLGEIVAACRSCRDAGEPVEPASVARRCPHGTTVVALASESVSLDLAEIDAETVWRAYLCREFVAECNAMAKEGLTDPTAVISSAPDRLRALADTIAGQGSRTKDSIRSQLAARSFSISHAPAAPQARFRLGGVPICTPGNLTAIAAGVKSGKSAFCGAMLAATISMDPETDCLGLSSQNREGWAVLHFDTEQSTFDHWQLINRALRRARVTQPPPWLLSFCLTGLPISESREAIAVACADARTRFGGIHCVIIDGIADLVADVNDAEESNGFVARLHGEAIRLDCPIVGVIHQNPGSEKTRGHLGSQMERKAETNLRLEKEQETVVVYSEKNRGAPITRDTGPRFIWSDEFKMHVSAQSLGSFRMSEKRRRLIEVAEAVFQDTKRSSLSWSDFIEAISRVERIGKSGARKQFDAMREHRVVSKDTVGSYYLTR